MSRGSAIPTHSNAIKGNISMNIYHPTIPYIYKWTHLATGKWYIGSKVRQGWNPSRHEEYLCSSKEVKPLILESREEWIYEILHTGDPEYIVSLETTILTSLDARNDPMSFNQHNGDGLYNRFGVKENKETRLKKREARLGAKNPMFGKKGNLSPHYGKTYSDERREKQSSGVKKYAECRPAAHNENISKSRMQGENNPMFGIPASDYNKAMTTLKNSGDNNPMKRSEHQRTCDHCGKTVAKNHYTMFHGDRCKSNPNAL